MKDFDTWNEEKKIVDQKLIEEIAFFYEREIWWCSIGINIGSEMDGKNANFERPVLILKRFNNQMTWCLSLTTKAKDSKFYFKLKDVPIESWVILSQFKTISSKRLIRKMGVVSEGDFINIKMKIINILSIENPPIKRVISEAEADSKLSIAE